MSHSTPRRITVILAVLVVVVSLTGQRALAQAVPVSYTHLRPAAFLPSVCFPTLRGRSRP